MCDFLVLSSFTDTPYYTSKSCLTKLLLDVFKHKESTRDFKIAIKIPEMLFVPYCRLKCYNATINLLVSCANVCFTHFIC